MHQSFLSKLASQFKPSSADPADTQGIPRLDSLRMTEEEERDFNSFSLAPVTVPQRSWRAHEDLKDLRSHSQAHDVSNTSQTHPVITQVIVQAQSTRSRSVQPIRDQIRLGNQSRTSLWVRLTFQSWCLKVMVKVKVDQLWFGMMI